jgi:hypothetical protein
MSAFFETMSSAYSEVRRLPLSVLRVVAKTRGRLAKLLEVK